MIAGTVTVAVIVCNGIEMPVTIINVNVHHNTLAMVASGGAGVTERYLFPMVGKDDYDPVDIPIRMDLW